MPRRHSASALLLLLAMAAGCSHKVVAPVVVNQRPVVRLTQWPAVPTSRYDYAYHMYWVGSDSDGEVDHFLYAVDPPAPTPMVPEPDTAWVLSRNNEEEFSFVSSQPDSVVPGSATYSTDYHVFAIKAVDNKRLESEPAIVAFNSRTIAPSVLITSPTPRAAQRQTLTPSLDIFWTGVDPDGRFSQEPLYYRTMMVLPSSPVPTRVAVQFEDSLRKYWAPRGWAGWDSLPGNVHYQHFSDLVPEQEYAFAIVAFDEAGAYTPSCSGNNNLLYFRAAFAQFSGPLITVFNDFFTYTYNTPSFRPNDPRAEIAIEIPASSDFVVNWTAEPYVGTSIGYFRWVLDPEVFEDYRPRTNERTDIHHWSVSSSVTTQCVIPPQTPGDHHLFIEAGDNNGLRSLAHIHFISVAPRFDRPLGIVDDSRLLPDGDNPNIAGCIDRPLGRWPTAAELDTFLYARGGVPMRCYPAGSFSRPGLFAGYDFDTLYTRTQYNDLTMPLSRLANYRYVIWLADPLAAEKDVNDASRGGKTCMRYMCEAGHMNTLAAYVRLGGEVWIVGGVLHCSLIPWNLSVNDQPSRYFQASRGEIRPGRFAWDYVHWRSDLRLAPAPELVRKFGRLESAPGLYAGLPDRLQVKSLADGDSLPPWRNASDFYSSSLDIEAMTLPNSIVEDYDPTLLGVDLRSTLDTLYVANGGAAINNGVVMTVYHGLENNRVITSGFPLWNIRLSQARSIVDLVLNRMWGLTRSSTAGAGASVAARSWRPPVEDAAVRSRSPRVR